MYIGSLKDTINRQIRSYCSPRHVPNGVFEIEEVPRTLNGKKLEVPIKKILMGVPPEQAVNRGSMSNPQSLEFFIEMSKKYPQ